MAKIILASASPRRRELLSQIGLEFQVVVSNADEDMENAGNSPDEIVMELSRQKANAVWNELMGDEATVAASDMVVIGADTVVSIDGRVLGKPAGRQEAIDMLTALSGRTHSVFTGVTLLDVNGANTFAEETRVYVYPMDRAEVERYADSGEPYDKAGGYGIQGLFAAYVSGIEGDYNNVVGLPVARIHRELKGMGHEV